MSGIHESRVLTGRTFPLDLFTSKVTEAQELKRDHSWKNLRPSTNPIPPKCKGKSSMNESEPSIPDFLSTFDLSKT